MATFNWTGSGDGTSANDANNWSVGGGAIPGSGGAGDVVNITTAGAAIVVTWNYEVANALGTFTVGAASGNTCTLKASRTANSLILMGSANIVLNATAIFDYGTSGDRIPDGVTAKVFWGAISDGVNGITIANGAKFYVYDYDRTALRHLALIKANVTVPATSDTMTVAGGDPLYIYDAGASPDHDYSSWNGKMLIVHKNPSGGYASYVNDFALLTVTSATYEAVNSRTVIEADVTHNPGGSATFYQYGYVTMVSSNVQLGKDNPSSPVGNAHANRPVITNNNSTNGSINVNGGRFIGWYNGPSTGLYFDMDKSVVANSYRIFNPRISNMANCDIYSTALGIISHFDVTLSGSRLYNFTANVGPATNGYGIISSSTNPFEIYGIYYCGNISSDMVYSNINIFGCVRVSNTGFVFNYDNCYLGYDKYGNEKPISSMINFAQNHGLVDNCKLPDTITTVNRNTAGYLGSVRFTNYDQTINDDRIYEGFGTTLRITADGSGDHPQPRTSDNDQVLEGVTLSNCNADNYYDIYGSRYDPIPLYLESGTEYTIDIYVQPEYTLTASELVLYVRYLNGTGGARTQTDSTGGGEITARSGADDWDEKLSVTFTPGATGFAYLWVSCLKAGGSTDYIYIDPLIDVTPKPSGVSSYNVQWLNGQPIMIPEGGTTTAAASVYLRRR